MARVVEARAVVLSLLAMVFVGLVAPRVSAGAELTQEAKLAARNEFNQGERAFEQQQYQEALRHYQRAHELAPLPGFLFNIGQCHRNLGNINDAVRAYERYLAELPKARNRSAVQTLIDELKQETAATTHKPTPAIPPYKPNPSSDNDRDVSGSGALLDPVGGEGERHPPPKKSPPRPFYKTWWFWVPVGALVVGGAAAGSYFALRDNGPSLPATDLGVIEVPR